MSASNKRNAQSPLSGDEDDIKRRIIMEDSPILVSLDEISEEENESTEGSELTDLLKHGDGKDLEDKMPPAAKVDSLINRMDRFMECFASLHSTVSKNQNSNNRKFKKLEEAHNDLAVKVKDTSLSTVSRLESLEARLKETQLENTKLSDQVKKLQDDHANMNRLQKQVNYENDKKFTILEEEQGVTNKTMHDCYSEVKERKLIISGVAEAKNEEVAKAALDNINKVIEAAIALKNPEENLCGLRKLHRGSIDNVYRIGKNARGPFSRNISVTFLRFDDKDMVIRAKLALKGDSNSKIFFNEDISNEGRALKAQLKRIAQIAKEQGKNAKVSGNKVTIESRSYYSNQLSMIPLEVAEKLKYEKQIEDGIVFKGEKSIFSNFYPAPFTVNGTVFQHVEQYYQYSKAIFHNESETADRIAKMSNPRRIKSLGDGIESDTTWLDQRMMALYRGIKAKFEQNWSLQDELILSQGKQLYEATTDQYFGCGISFESPRWSRRDWPGENVAGLILMKVREELLSIQSEGRPINNTLSELASEDNLDSSLIMDVQDGTVPERPVHNTSASKADPVTKTPTFQPPSQHNRSKSDSVEVLTQPGRSDAMSGTSPYEYPPASYYSQPVSQARGSNRRGKGRGRGRGRNARGRGSWGNHGQQRQPPTRTGKQNNIMSDSDRNFLCGQYNMGNNNTTRNSSPKSKSYSNPLGLNEQQVKGLALLGFNLPAGITS